MITCIAMVFHLPVFPLIFSPVAVSPSIVYSVILYSTIFSFSMDCHWMVGLTLVIILLYFDTQKFAIARLAFHIPTTVCLIIAII